MKSHHWQSSLVGLISFFFFVFFNLMSFSFLLTTFLYFACIDLFSFWLPSLLWVSFQIGSSHRLPYYLFITLLLHTLEASHSPSYSPPNFLKQTFHKKRYTCIWLLFVWFFHWALSWKEWCLVLLCVLSTCIEQHILSQCLVHNEKINME